MLRLDILFIEITSVVLFLYGIFNFRKFNKSRVLEFVMMAVYGFLLEELDMRIFRSYHYSPDFMLTFMNVPISIALLWAVILAGAMAITDRMGLPSKIRPVMDAVLVVWIDLALDAIAIRLDYWTWKIPIHEGWFGVPAGNLYAWMWVAFAYSFLARHIRIKMEQNNKWILAYIPMPIPAYILLFFTMGTVGFTGELLGFKTQNEKLIVFALQFIAFVALILRFWPAERTDKPASSEPFGFWTGTRFFMHLYFFIAYFVMGMHRELPALGVIAAFVLILEILFLKLVLDPRYSQLCFPKGNFKKVIHAG